MSTATIKDAYGPLATADIHQIVEESRQVLRLRLKIPADQSFSFTPGQWVDFHIPDTAHIGGFSICTPPSLLQQQGYLDLAVQRSRSPPAAWVHDVAAPGMQVRVQVGGQTSLQPHHCEAPCLFIGGGIGVAPLVSMWNHWAEEWHSRAERDGPQSSNSSIRATMLYTVKSAARCALLQQLLHPLQGSSPPMQLHVHLTAQGSTPITGSPPSPHHLHRLSPARGCTQPSDASTAPQPAALEVLLQSPPPGCSVTEARLSVQHLAQHLAHLGSGCHVFLCGPPAMSDWAYEALTGELGHAASQVHLEKWCTFQIELQAVVGRHARHLTGKGLA
ncbi:MAG: hypothetical protein WDW36_005900 [Sanguina aurantia]